MYLNLKTNIIWGIIQFLTVADISHSFTNSACLFRETDTYELSYNIGASKSVTFFEWRRSNNVPLLTCSKCSCKSYIFTFNGTVNCLENYIESSTLVINTLSRTFFEDLFPIKCFVNLTFILSPPCSSAQVYVLPEVNSCTTPVVDNTGIDVSLTCETNKTYPEAGCIISVREKNYTCTTCTSSSYISLGNTYMTTNCKFVIQVAFLELGKNSFSNFLYPNTTNGTQFAVKANDVDIYLDLPLATFGICRNTSEDYIKVGESYSCECTNSTKGNLPAYFQWYDNTNQTLSKKVLKRVADDIGVPDTIFYCQPQYLWKDSIVGPKIKFVAKFAYGPTKVQIIRKDNFNQSDPYILCPNSGNITFLCQVLKATVNPEPSITMYQNNLPLSFSTQHNNSSYNYISSFQPSSVDSLLFGCLVVNSKYPELITNASLKLLVRGPPSKPPLLSFGQGSYSGNDHKTVETQKEGSDIEITCEVSGGFPNTYNITVSCGDSYNNSVTARSAVELSIKNVERQLNGKQCVCEAEHITPCYITNRSSVTLNITFPAKVKKFTANSNSSSLTVSNNSDVILLCDTESNPAATVEIFKTEQITVDTSNVNYTRKVICEDSGEYFCRARNTDFVQPSQSSLIIYVRCPLQLKNANENYKIFSAHKGSNAVITFDVLGFPAPVSYSFFKNNNEYKYIVNNDSLDSSIESKYKFEYLPKALHYGSIKVTMFNLIDGDFTNYSLSINNSLDSELTLSFVLIQGNTQEYVDIQPAAVGGGIACFAFIIVIIIIAVILMGKIHSQHLWKTYKCSSHHQNAEQDHQNSDIYIFKSKNGLDVEINYKNYSDVPITITTATALPKNLKLKSKPTMPTYFNSIDAYSKELSFEEADTSHLITKEIKKNDSVASYARDISCYENNDSDVYANT